MSLDVGHDNSTYARTPARRLPSSREIGVLPTAPRRSRTQCMSSRGSLPVYSRSRTGAMPNSARSRMARAEDRDPTEPVDPPCSPYSLPESQCLEL